MNEMYMSYLTHHGVLGQKHGRRRWQNPDGSLTPAGRERYRKASNKADKLETKRTKAGLKAAKADKALYSAKKKLQKAEKKGKDTSDLAAKIEKLEKKSVNLNLKSAKLNKKTNKWIKKMSKEFSGVNVRDLSTEDLKNGKQFASMILKVDDNEKK